MKRMPFIAIFFWLPLLWSCSGSGGQQMTQNRRDTVIIKMMAFNPATISVARGDTIVWINEDIVAHDVSQWPDKGWHSDTLDRGASYEKVVTDSSSYFCSIHPTMKGKFLISE